MKKRRRFLFKAEAGTDLDKGGIREETEARKSESGCPGDFWRSLGLRRITRQGGLRKTLKITRKRLRRSKMRVKTEKTTMEKGMDVKIELLIIRLEDISRVADDLAELLVDVKSLLRFVAMDQLRLGRGQPRIRR